MGLFNNKQPDLSVFDFLNVFVVIITYFEQRSADGYQPKKEVVFKETRIISTSLW